MFFDLQRFDDTTALDAWLVLTEYDDTHYTETDTPTSDPAVFWGFVPAGASFTNGRSKTFDNNTGRAAVILKDAVKLKINKAEIMWSENTGIRDTGAWRLMAHGVIGNATAVTLDLYNGQTVDDLVVEGENKTDLKITIGRNGTVYNVYYDGSVDIVPPAGLMKKADKRKLDKFDPLTYMKEADASQQFAMKHEALGGGEMTADGFVLKNVAGIGVATITSVGLDAETAAATYATKEEMRQYVKQVIASSSGYTFVDGSGTTVAEIPVMS